jgi:hypothetical protein
MGCLASLRENEGANGYQDEILHSILEGCLSGDRQLALILLFSHSIWDTSGPEGKYSV